MLLHISYDLTLLGQVLFFFNFSHHVLVDLFVWALLSCRYFFLTRKPLRFSLDLRIYNPL
jgi:hypothetical protein